MKKNTKIFIGVAAAVVALILFVRYRRNKSAAKPAPAPQSSALTKPVVTDPTGKVNTSTATGAAVSVGNFADYTGTTGGTMPQSLSSLTASDIVKLNNTNLGNEVANVAPLSVTVPINPRGGYYGF